MNRKTLVVVGAVIHHLPDYVTGGTEPHHPYRKIGRTHQHRAAGDVASPRDLLDGTPVVLVTHGEFVAFLPCDASRRVEADRGIHVTGAGDGLQSPHDVSTVDCLADRRVRSGEVRRAAGSIETRPRLSEDAARQADQAKEETDAESS